MLGSRPEVPDDEAVELLRAALDTALDRGALGIQRRARAALARRGRPDESGRDAQRCPTSTERRIVELAAAGHGIRDVAQQLFLTPGHGAGGAGVDVRGTASSSPQVRRRILGR